MNIYQAFITVNQGLKSLLVIFTTYVFSYVLKLRGKFWNTYSLATGKKYFLDVWVKFDRKLFGASQYSLCGNGASLVATHLMHLVPDMNLATFTTMDLIFYVCLYSFLPIYVRYYYIKVFQ